MSFRLKDKSAWPGWAHMGFSQRTDTIWTELTDGKCSCRRHWVQVWLVKASKPSQAGNEITVSRVSRSGLSWDRAGKTEKWGW